MLIYNKIILVSNLDSLYQLLNNNDNESLYSCKCIYDNRIAIQHYINKKNINIIRIWRTKSLFDYWFDKFNSDSKNFIATFDYTIHTFYIKINYIYVNNEENKINKMLYINNLNENETENLITSIINFIKIVAKNENKKKIILDVHQNLNLYKKYYIWEGFRITNRKCSDNPFWCETELNI